MSTFTYEGVSFNKEWAAAQTEADFVKHEKHHDLTPAQLKEAYKLIKKEMNQAKKAEVPVEQLPDTTVNDEGKVVSLSEAANASGDQPEGAGK
jgi:hypothetical protein